MGKIGEWETIAEKIEESLFFEAVLSFEEEKLIRPIFPSYAAEYAEEGVSVIKRTDEEAAVPIRLGDIFFKGCEEEEFLPEGSYAAELLGEEERATARFWEAEERALEGFTGGNTSLYSAAEENAAYDGEERDVIFGKGYNSAEYEGMKGTDTIEDAVLSASALYEVNFPEEEIGVEYRAPEEQFFEMIYDRAKEYGGEEISIGEGYINKLYNAEKIGRSGAKRIIESISEGRSGESREVKIEMVNNNNISSKVDIDAVADMLTMRICDIMNRSADGMY